MPAKRLVARSYLQILVLVAAAGALVAAGCRVGPRYVAPKVDVAPAFRNATTQPFADGAAGEPASDWWSAFADPVLTRLVEDARAHNHDLRIATSGLRQARALLLEARYEFYPIAPATAGYERQRLSRANALPTGRDRDLYFAQFDATWELDLFGRVSRAVEARAAQVGAADAELQDVLVSVAAEVARNYFELRGAQDRLGVARRNAENQSRTYGLTVSLLEGGRGTDLDTSRAKAQLESTLATIPPLEAAVEQAIYRVAVLTGRQPAQLAGTLEAPAAVPVAPPRVAIGDPAGLLRRRPDVRAAERTLAAAVARVGVATADLYPRIQFVGTFGAEATQVGDLGKGGDFFAIGPRLTWAAFDLGRVRARLRASRADADARLAEFERAVLLALEETDGALVAYAKQLARLEHLRAAAQASGTASDLARQQYETGGIGDFLTVLDAERRMLETQDELAEGRTRAATALVAIFKALGGGWERGTPPSPRGDGARDDSPEPSEGSPEGSTPAGLIKR